METTKAARLGGLCGQKNFADLVFVVFVLRLLPLEQVAQRGGTGVGRAGTRTLALASGLGRRLA